MVVEDNEVALSSEVDPAGQRAQVRRAALASSIGTTIEWYDFFLYNTAAALVFPHLFFPASSPYAGAMASFATYAVGFVARPLGAAIFGHWGDRIGRKANELLGKRVGLGYRRSAGEPELRERRTEVRRGSRGDTRTHRVVGIER